MNLLNQPSVYQIELSAKELTLVAKALAKLGGLEVNARGDEVEMARDLNLRILRAREEKLKNELKMVQDALVKADEAEG